MKSRPFSAFLLFALVFLLQICLQDRTIVITLDANNLLRNPNNYEGTMLFTNDTLVFQISNYPTQNPEDFTSQLMAFDVKTRNEYPISQILNGTPCANDMIPMKDSKCVISWQGWKENMVLYDTKTQDATLLKSWEHNPPISKTKKISDSEVVLFSPNTTETGYTYDYTYINIDTGEEKNILHTEYKDADISGNIASTFGVYDRNIYVFNKFYHHEMDPDYSVIVYNLQGEQIKQYNVDLKKFLDLSFEFSGLEDFVTGVFPYEKYIILETQHDRYYFIPTEPQYKVPKLPIELLNPLTCTAAYRYDPSFDSLFFYNREEGVNSYYFDAEKVKFYKTVIKSDYLPHYFISSCIQNEKGDLLFILDPRDIYHAPNMYYVEKSTITDQIDWFRF